MTQLYLSAMDAIYAVAPHIPFFLEVTTGRTARRLFAQWYSDQDARVAMTISNMGLLQGAAQGGVGANWGDGFCCDAALVKQLGLSDPSALFRAVMSRPYRDQARIILFWR